MPRGGRRRSSARRGVVVVGAHAAGDVDAVDLGQPEVQHDQVGEERVRLLQRGLAVARQADLVALQAQGALQDLGDLLVVLDDQDADGAG
jgi:hypothetical protein